MPWKAFQQSPWPRRLLYGLVGLSIVLGIGLALRPSPLPVDVATVERGSLRVTVAEEGKTRVRSRYVIAAPVAGRLNRIDLEAGDAVKQGAVVATIDPLPLSSQVQTAQARLRELQAQRSGVATLRPKTSTLQQAEARIRVAQAAQRQAEANVDATQAALEQARRDRQRAAALAASGAIPRQEREVAELRETTRAKELEAARRAAEAATAEVIAAQEARQTLQAEQQDPDYLLRVYNAQIAGVQAELANLADTASRTTITAPVSGQVLTVQQKSARYVEAGTPLLDVGNPSALELVVDVLSTDAIAIQPGAPVVVEQWGGDRPLSAKVRYVEPSAFTKVSALGVEEQRVNVIADFERIPPGLGDGFRVEAQIVTWQGQDRLTIPVSALFRCANQRWCTFVAHNGSATQRTVEIGHRNQSVAEVKAGLQVGDQVILHPSEQLEEGSRIEVRSP